MKKIKKDLVTVLIAGGLIFGSGYLVGHNNVVPKPKTYDELIELKTPYIQTMFDRKIKRMGSNAPFSLEIIFEDNNEIEILYDIINSENKLPSKKEFKEGDFTYQILEVIEITWKGRDLSEKSYMPEDLTPTEERFYKSIVRNIDHFKI